MASQIECNITITISPIVRWGPVGPIRKCQLRVRIRFLCDSLQFGVAFCQFQKNRLVGPEVEEERSEEDGRKMKHDEAQFACLKWQLRLSALQQPVRCFE
jgi:hypothetical protein